MLPSLESFDSHSQLGIKEGTNRKFQTGKTAKKLAESLIKMQQENQDDQQKESQAVIDEFNAKRGYGSVTIEHSSMCLCYATCRPSLMEAHQDKTAKKPKIVSDERLSFDRERVFIYFFL